LILIQASLFLEKHLRHRKPENNCCYKRDVSIGLVLRKLEKAMTKDKFEKYIL